MTKPLYYRVMETPIGDLIVGATETGVCSVVFGSDEAALARLREWAQKRLSRDSLREERTDLLAEAILQLRQYFAGERTRFTTPLELRGTAFQRKVWRRLSRIPFGSVQSYKQVATAIDAPNAARAVGGANNQNPLAIIVPCHRVVAADGSLGGYGAGLEKKEFLLNLERDVLKRMNSSIFDASYIC